MNYFGLYLYYPAGAELNVSIRLGRYQHNIAIYLFIKEPISNVIHWIAECIHENLNIS